MHPASSIHSLKPPVRFPGNRPAPEGRARSGRQHRHADIAPTTGPFGAFHDRARVLIVADVENIAYGGRDLGVAVDFGKLADRLRTALLNPALHAVFSAPPRDDRVGQFLSALGWTPYQREIVGRHTNADIAIGFHAAALLARTNADACVVATGDGGLALDIAQGIRAAFAHCSLIGTMSLAGSTSRLIDSRNTRHIDVNLEIGRDVMHAAMPDRLDISSVPPTALAS